MVKKLLNRLFGKKEDDNKCCDFEIVSEPEDESENDEENF